MIVAISDPEAPGPIPPAGPKDGILVTIDTQQSGVLDKSQTRVVAEFRSGYTEVVWEQGDYTPRYGGPSPPGHVFEPPGTQYMTVKRIGGWPTSFTLHVFAVIFS